MAMTVDQLHHEVLTLPPDQREELVIRLLKDWQRAEEAEPLSPEWIAEIRRRADEMDAGVIEARDGYKVLAELRAKFGLR